MDQINAVAEKSKEVLKDLGVNDYDRAELTMMPNDWMELGEEDLAKMKTMLAELDEVEDVQAVYHNVDNL